MHQTLFSESKQGGPSTIGEVTSIFYDGGSLPFRKLLKISLLQDFYASILGMVVLAVNLFRKPKSHEVLLFVWSIFILLSIYSQNRFAYYYSINVSLLSAYLGGLLLDKVKWSELDQKFKSTVKSPADLPNALKFIKVQQVLAVLAIVVFLIYPVYGSAMQQATGSNDPPGPWMEACTWLRSNTPDPGMDYNAIYEAPKNGELFKYPDTCIWCYVLVGLRTLHRNNWSQDA